MWTTILTAVTALIGLATKWIGGSGSGDKDQRELGRAEQQNADMKDGTATIRRATDAAKAAEQEEPSNAPDPHDRARRR